MVIPFSWVSAKEAFDVSWKKVVPVFLNLVGVDLTSRRTLEVL